MTELEFSITLGIGVFLLRRTDAVFWYARGFGIVSASYLKERKAGANYLDWLNKERDNFWTELLVCPFCMATWLSFAAVGFYGIEAGPWSWLTIVATYGALAFFKAALVKWT